MLEYIDIDLLNYIECAAAQEELDRWAAMWEATLREKGALGSISHEVEIKIYLICSQIVFSLEALDKKGDFELRLRSAHRNPDIPAEFSPIPPDEWFERPFGDEIVWH